MNPSGSPFGRERSDVLCGRVASADITPLDHGTVSYTSRRHFDMGGSHGEG